jgi:DNA polymerase III subunit epsilon
MKFMSIDFETANQKWDSVCAVGMVMVENGEIVKEYYSLVNPEDHFSSFNISIHGITAQDVAAMPNFHTISQQIWPWLAGNLVIAHNATFDINVLKKVSQKYGLLVPEFHYACTCQIARLAWANLENHRLSTVARHLSLELQHHNAMSDARACAGIMVKAMREYGCEDMAGFNRKTGYKVRQV